MSKIYQAILPLAVVALTGGCPSGPVASDRCNDSSDCNASELCVDGICEIDVSPTPSVTPEAEPDGVEPDGNPEQEPGVGPVEPDGEPTQTPEAEPEAEPAQTPEAEPEAEPEPAQPSPPPPLDGGSDGGPSTDAGSSDDAGADSGTLDGGNTPEPPPEPDAGDDGGVDAGPGGDTDGGEVDGGPFGLAIANISRTAINDGETIALTLTALAVGASCDVIWETDTYSIGVNDPFTITPDADGTLTLVCSSIGETQTQNFDFLVFSAALSVAAIPNGAEVSYQTSHSTGCIVEWYNEVVWAGAGVDIFTIPHRSGEIVLICDGANGNDLITTLFYAVGFPSVEAVRVDVDGPEVYGIWNLESRAFCTLERGGETLFTDQLLTIGDNQFILGTPQSAAGNWLLTCRNDANEVDGDTLVVDPFPNADDIHFDLATGLGSGGIAGGTPLVLKWNLVGECSVNGEQIFSNQDSELIDVVEDPQTTVVFECTSNVGTVQNSIRILAGSVTLPHQFNPHAVFGDVSIDSANVNLPGLEAIAGSLVVGNTATGVLEAHDLVGIGGLLGVENEGGLTEIDLDRVRRIDAGIFIVSNFLLDEIRLDGLQYIGELVLEDLPSLTRLDFDALQFVAGQFSLFEVNNITDLDVRFVEYIGGNLSLENVSNLDELDFGALVDVGNVFLGNNGSLVDVYFDDLFSVERLTVEGNSELETLVLPSLNTASNKINIIDNRLLDVLVGGALTAADAVDISENGTLPNSAAEAFVNGANVTNAVVTCPNLEPCDV